MHKQFVGKFSLAIVGALVIAVTISLWSASRAATTFSYSVTDLGSLGGNSSVAYDINDAAQVVGYSYTNTGKQHAFLWQNRTMTDLDPLNEGYSIAYGINYIGQAVGYSTRAGSAALWQNGTMNSLASPDRQYPTAYQINNSGQIVGSALYAVTHTIYYYPVLWQNGTVTILPTLSPPNYMSLAFYNSANSINDAGQVVGYSQSPDGNSHATLWQNGTATDLGTLPGGTTSQANSINKVGKVVGWSNSSSGLHAALWYKGQKRDLGSLGGNATKATAINNYGMIVGYSFTVNNYNEIPLHPFVWRTGTMTDLNTLLPSNSGWELVTANAVNNRGQIVGQGRFNGQTRAYLLTPIRRTT